MSYKKIREAVDLLEVLEGLKTLKDKLESQPPATEMNRTFDAMFGKRTTTDSETGSTAEYLMMALKMLESPAKFQQEAAGLLNSQTKTATAMQSNVDNPFLPQMQSNEISQSRPNGQSKGDPFRYMSELLSPEDILAALKNATENSFSYVLITDAQQNIIYTNPALEKVSGFSLEELKGKSPKVYNGPDVDNAMLGRVNQALASKEDVHEPMLNYMKDGSTRWMDVHIRPIFDNKGVLKCFVSVTEDLQGRGKLNEISQSRPNGQSKGDPFRYMSELLSPEDILAALKNATENSFSYVLITDAQQNIIYTNPALEKVSGFSLEELKGKSPKVYNGPDVDNAMLGRVNQALASKEDVHEPMLNYMKDGSTRWMDVHIRPIFDNKGVLKCFVSVTEDLQGRGKLNEVQEQQKGLKNAVDNAYNTILITDNSQRITYVNQAFEKMTGYTFEEVKGKNPRLLQGPDTDKEATKKIRQMLANRISVDETLLNYTKDGRPYWINIKVRPIVDDKGMNTGFVAIEEDVTEKLQIQAELQQAQTQLIQSEKLSSLGQMVAGLAHEINTPLAFVRGNMDLLASKHQSVQKLLSLYFTLRHKITSGNTDGLSELISSIDNATEEVLAGRVFRETESIFANSVEGIDRIQDLILNLKNFSRLDEAISKVSDINDGLDSTLKIAGHLLKGGIEVERHYGDLPKVMCSPAQLNQVFLNIITNAVQAMDKNNGKLTIHTKATGDNVVIEIGDNGKGMDEKTLARIFEPFFTTKDVGQGTGLGLSIAYKIIENHKGKISAKSEVGKGTVFTIELPAATDAKPEQTITNQYTDEIDSPFASSPEVTTMPSVSGKAEDAADHEREKWKKIVDKVMTKN